MGNALWNVLGGNSKELSVDAFKLTLEQDDVLPLCTDGLYDIVPHEELEGALNCLEGAESACRKLVDLANSLGGHDNTTAIVPRFFAPQPDQACAFVEVEVPLTTLTAPNEDVTSATALITPIRR